MADSLVQEANTQLINDFSSMYFYHLPTDQRFISTEFHRYSPTNALTDGSDVRFFLPAFTGAAVYILKDTYVEVKVCLQLANAKIPAGGDVSVVNNTTHSLFKTCSMYLNDEIVNKDFDNYHYKAYIKNVLSFSNALKSAQISLGTDNFFADGAFNFDEMSDSNKGYGQRRKAFAKVSMEGSGSSTVKTITYHGEDVTFIAKLQHDLVTCNTPVLPGVAVRIELTLNPHKLLVLSKSDTDNYELKIKDIFLHVPVALLEPSLYSSIESRLKEKPALMHYTRTVISRHEIPLNSTAFTSDHLFLRTQIPSKIIIGFVRVDALYGKNSLNCFNFARRWGGSSLHATQGSHVMSPSVPNDDDDDIDILDAERRLADLRRELQGNVAGQRRNSISARLQRFMGLRNDPNVTPGTEQIVQRIADLEDTVHNLRAASRRRNQHTPVPEGQQLGAEFDPGLFIESTVLTLNGKPIDSLSQEKATARQDTVNFVRMHHFMNFNDSLLTNSISEEDFLGGNFFLVYDMSTCSRSNQSFMVPSIRLGTLEFTVRFNKAMTEKLTMIIFQEHPSLISINENRKVSASYSMI